jgi:hypothetical protein
MTPRHAPEASLEGHLALALKYEGLDLAVLKRLFTRVGPAPIEAMAREKPTGTYSRRVWFLCEWLTGENLDLPDAQTGRYVPCSTPTCDGASKGEQHPATGYATTCPAPHNSAHWFRTRRLDDFVAEGLAQRASDIVANVTRDLLARTAAFLLIKDSKSRSCG